MKEKLEAYCRALDRLGEALKDKPTAMNRDATIQRFEFTYELAWNVLKKYLIKVGFDCLNPRECFKGAFQQKFIDDEGEQIWLDMIKDRNLTSHLYNEDTAFKIYQKIKNKYFRQFELLRDRLKEKLL